MFNNQECPNCGKKVKDSYEYCPYCGEQIEIEEDDWGLLGIKDDFKTQNLSPFISAFFFVSTEITGRLLF